MSEITDEFRAIADGAERPIHPKHLRRAVDEIERLEAIVNRFQNCRWTFDATRGAWDSACQRKWQFDSGGPNRDGVQYCPYCGRRIEEVTE